MKQILFLSSYKFTEFDYFKWEINFFKKKLKCKVIIHDLSKILVSPRFNKVWKTPEYRYAFKASSLLNWFKMFSKLKKTNLIVYNLIGVYNLKSFLIKLILHFYDVKVINYSVDDVKQYVPDKNINFYIKKILINKFNLKLYYFYIHDYLFKSLDKIFLKKNNYYLKSENSEKNNIIASHSQDFSNILSYNIQDRVNSKKFIVYLDTGGPFFTGDALLNNLKLPENNNELFYKNLNSFFDYLEKIFKKRVIIVPHSKFKNPSLKDKNYIHYFNNRRSINDYDALPKLVNKTFFFISRGSTAISYGIVKSIPIQIIYSSSYNYLHNEKNDLKLQSKTLGTKLIDIDKYSEKKLRKNLKVNIDKFKRYKLNFLSSIKNEKPNYQIINKFFLKYSNEKKNKKTN